MSVAVAAGANQLSKKEAKRLKREEEEEEEERRAFERQLKKDELARDLDCVRKAESELKTRLRALSTAENRPVFKDIMMQNWNSFNEAMDRKDWVISEIMEYIDRVNALQRKQNQSYAMCVHRILADYWTEVREIQDCYRLEVDIMIAHKEYALHNVKESQNYQEEYRKTILFSMDRQLKDYFIRRGSEFMSKTDEENNKNKWEKNDLTTVLETKLHNLWNSCNGYLSTYVKQTEKRAAEIKILWRRDEKNRHLIRNQEIKLEYLYNIIKDNRRIVREPNLGPQVAADLQLLRKEKRSLQDKYRTIRRAEKAVSEKHSEDLVRLVISSKTVISHLQQVHRKGEKIMKMYNYCRKMETQSEQEHNFMPIQPRLQHCKIDCLDKMIAFYQKTGAAEIVTRCLLSKRNELRAKNTSLINRLTDIDSMHSSLPNRCESIPCSMAHTTLPPIISMKNSTKFGRRDSPVKNNLNTKLKSESSLD